MTLAMTVALVVALMLAGLLASRLRFEARMDEDARLLRVRWLVASLGYDLRSRTVRGGVGAWQPLRTRAGRAERAEPPPKRKRSRRSEGPGLRPLLRERDAIARDVRYALQRMHLERLHAQCTFGAEDPATTGMLYGFASSLLAPLAATSPAIRIHLDPDFMEERLEGRLDARLSVRIFYLLVIGLRAVRLRRRLVARRP